jgi:cytoskeleton-associated protein 5
MELIDFAKTTLACTTPALRTAATSLIKVMYQNIGKDLLNFLNDVNPQQLKPLLTELDKVQPYTDAQKKSKISFLGEAAQDVKEDNRGGGGNPLDSLPRADISNEANKLLKKMGDAQWKTRKEGLDALESLLTSNNNRISSNNLHDLVACLKQRLNDPNKSLARGFITFVGKFVEACGKDVKQYSKTLLTPLISNLSDKQGMIRTDVLSSMDKFSAIIGADNIINLSPTFLANESFEMRIELIGWLIKNSESFPKSDLKPFVAPVLS